MTVIGYDDNELRSRVINSNECVLIDDSIKILFIYPLSRSVLFEYFKEKFFLRINLYRSIHEGYNKIYDMEFAIASDLGTIKIYINITKSNNPYRIWGHYIEDIYIEGIY